MGLEPTRCNQHKILSLIPHFILLTWAKILINKPFLYYF